MQVSIQSRPLAPHSWRSREEPYANFNEVKWDHLKNYKFVVNEHSISLHFRNFQVGERKQFDKGKVVEQIESWTPGLV